MEKNKPTSLNFEIENVTSVNRFISECEIKVFYHGQNRNGSFISKPVGEQIAKTLPRAPIVAVYNKEKEDFEDHGEEIIVNRDGIQFIKKTVPYGAIDTEAKPEWKTFIDHDGVEREYMTVKGYLWTGRYPELNSILESPKGQSMELFEESVKGVWAKLDNQETETFIFNEAAISALCILGDDVEPCFEGANVAPIDYSLDENKFTAEFNKFMFELKNALEGGESMNLDNFSVSEATTAVEKAEESKTKEDIATARELVNKLEDGEEKTALIERLNKIKVEDESEDKEDKEDKENFDLDGEDSEDSETETEGEDTEGEVEEPETPEEPEVPEEDEIIDDSDDGAKKRKMEFEVMKEELEALKVAHEELKSEYSRLSEEFSEKERSEKEELLEKFSLLGEEVITSFSNSLDEYKLEDLEKELSALAFKEGLNFQALKGADKLIVPNPVRTDKPAWVKALEKYNK